MTSAEALAGHLRLCDDLHLLALEENRILKSNQHLPDPAITERRRRLLADLEESLTAVRAAGAEAPPADPTLREQRRQTIEHARARILQILHLQRENEQLVLRFSLSAPRAPAASGASPPPVSQLQKLYERHR
jgi:uncharacterized membrane protein YccC